MRIIENGNVGIGTTSPSYPLTINKPNPPFLAAFNNSTSSGSNGAQIAFDIQGIGSASIGMAPGSMNLIFATGPGWVTTERMRINSSGYVGIGTNNPTNILQVGAGGRLRIGNDASDYTLIGTLNSDQTNNTRIVISGNTRTTFGGAID